MPERIISGPDHDYTTSFTEADWGTVVDKYAPTGQQLRPSNLRLELDNSSLSEAGRYKPPTNGAELFLDPKGLAGKAVVYYDSWLPSPRIKLPEGVLATINNQVSIGPNSQREHTLILEGSNGKVALALTEFRLNPNTITIREKPEGIKTIQPNTSHSVAA